jgi:predicted lipoprotein
MTEAAIPRFNRTQLVLAGVVVAVLVAMALDTKVVVMGSAADVKEAKFEPAAFGTTTFPQVQADVTARAVDAVELAKAIAADTKAATDKYAISGVFPVKLTGVVGDGKSGIYNVTVDGLPDPLKLRVQTGPAINGTELRDATGKISFSDFTNQIEYQDAGSAINNVLKTEVLAKIDNSALTGKTISVVGAFKLVNPKNWLITPVSLEVK